mgnify:CR=1 FL=1
MIYAVKYKSGFEFGCLSKTKEELEDKIVKAKVTVEEIE